MQAGLQARNITVTTCKITLGAFLLVSLGFCSFPFGTFKILSLQSSDEMQARLQARK